MNSQSKQAKLLNYQPHYFVGETPTNCGLVSAKGTRSTSNHKLPKFQNRTSHFLQGVLTLYKVLQITKELKYAQYHMSHKIREKDDICLY
nr:hypothetical protein Iba_chr15fCG4550 [Ipomoea batatas]